MQIHSSHYAIRRGASILFACIATTIAFGQCGCTTSFPEWVNNGFKVGPNYNVPPAPVPQAWVDAPTDKRVHVANPNIAAWWDVFDDPILTQLVKNSFVQNLTVRQAAYQILQAREQRAIAIGELLPQSQSAILSYLHGETSNNGGSAAAAAAAFGASLTPGQILTPVTPPSTPVAGVTPSTGAGSTTSSTSPSVGSGSGSGAGVGFGTSRFFNNVATSLNLSWELDFWGLFRRNLESADASLDQSIDNYDEMVVLLLANVATQYVEIRTLQKRLDLARKNVALQEPLVEVYRQRYKAGIANSFPGYHQLKSNLDNTRALIPSLEISLRQANNQLCILLGIPVRDLLPELGDGTAPDPNNPKDRIVRIPRPKDESVVVGIPGDLLLRRPDVLAAERQLQIQSAQIGIAEAEMYPHIGINGSIGLAANKLGTLFNSQSWTGSIGPSLTWNILIYGRLLANVRFQDDLYQQYVANYQNTVLTANQDAENAMVAYLKSIDQTRHLQDSADAAAKLTGYLVKQFKEGYLPPGAHGYQRIYHADFHGYQFPGHAAGLGGPGRRQHRPESHPPVQGHGRRLGNPPQRSAGLLPTKCSRGPHRAGGTAVGQATSCAGNGAIAGTAGLDAQDHPRHTECHARGRTCQQSLRIIVFCILTLRVPIAYCIIKRGGFRLAALSVTGLTRQ